ncbi:MAG: BamA/TamA family outer membrane protein, partial [Pseudomonadota bacterium]
MTLTPRTHRAVALHFIAAVVSGCASQDFEEVAFERPETAVEYEVLVKGAPSEAVQALIEESLLLARRQEDGAQSLAFLRRRAQGDIETVQKIMRSFGYYQAEVETDVREVASEPTAEGEAAEEPAATEDEDEAAEEAAKTQAIAEVIVTPGPAFTLAQQDISLSGFGDGPQPALGPAEAYGAPIGEPAAAAEILAAEGAVLSAIREQGFPYAVANGRDAVADLDLKTIEVESRFETGRFHRLGPITIKGAPNVDDDYILTYLPFAEGDIADPAKLSEFQREILSTGLFRAGFVTLPEEPPQGEVAPVTVELEEREFRTVSAGGRFDSDEGPGVRLSFEHRNLFGSNETLNLVLDATTDEQRFTATGTKPQFKRSGQDLIGSAEVRRIDDDAFDEIGGTLTLGVVREVTPKWTIGFGGLAEFSDIDDGETEAVAYLFGIPLTADYDGSDNELNPTRGERLRIGLTPFGGIFDDRGVGFLVADVRGSLYRRLTDDGRWVGAVRGRFGAIPSGSLDDVPATRRLYSGGAGSVRGFEQDFVGPLDDDGDPI